MTEPIARVHLDDLETEVHYGDDALVIAEKMANIYREDFPDSIVGVSYNPAAFDAKAQLLAENRSVEENPG